MRLSTLQLEDAGTRAAVQDGDDWALLDAAELDGLLTQPAWRDMAAKAVADAASVRIPAANAKLLRPIIRPTKILCCGLNYRDHIAETGRETPDYPTLFGKFADTLTDPDADISVVGSAKVDWEAELAVVIGGEVWQADAQSAEQAIAGYTIANDVSMRDWQSRTLQWLQGKAWDRTTPLGPVLVTADELDPRAGLEISVLVDDETMQHSNTRELLFDAPALVAYVSQFTRLRPGDIILTGTPGGVGLGREPQRFLADGELLTTRIEGIGELRNRFQIAPVAA
jgi:acylpyruvate hydrolase